MSLRTFIGGSGSQASGLGLAICRWVARAHGGDFITTAARALSCNSSRSILVVVVSAVVLHARSGATARDLVHRNYASDPREQTFAAYNAFFVEMKVLGVTV